MAHITIPLGYWNRNGWREGVSEIGKLLLLSVLGFAITESLDYIGVIQLSLDNPLTSYVVGIFTIGGRGILEYLSIEKAKLAAQIAIPAPIFEVQQEVSDMSEETVPVEG